MTDRKPSRPRLVTARRVSTLTGVAALTAAGMISSAEAQGEGEASEPQSVLQDQAEGEGEGEGHAESTAQGEGEGESHASGDAQGEGEGEGAAGGESEASADASAGGEGEGEGEGAIAGEGESEGARPEDPEVTLLTGLAFMEGHMRAGLALYEEGDLAAAKAHMRQPLEDRYESLEAQLERAGQGALEDRIEALAEATEGEAELSELEDHFAEVRAAMEAVRGEYPAIKQVTGLINLTRTAGADYAAALAEDGTLADLQEYQDSWGFLRAVEAEASRMAESDDEALAKVGRTLLEQVEVAGEAYGDLQGGGSFEADPAVIYGAAARMDLASLALGRVSSSSEGEGEAGASPEGEGEGASEAGHEGEGEGEGGAGAASEGEGESH